MLSIGFLAFKTGQALASGNQYGNYFGTGHFPGGQYVRWEYAGISSGYETRANLSISRWDTFTDANFIKVTSSEDILVEVENFGQTWWYGVVRICNVNWQCDNSTAYNSTYHHCKLRFNTYYSGAWSNAEKENTFMHETGHCLSLAHHTTPANTIMHPVHSAVNWLIEYDRNLVNLRY
jgi:predicted Zn-dependent protease